MRHAVVSALVIALLALAAAPAPVQGWLPPPPEFSDVTADSGVDFPIHRWSPALGPAQGLLDVLPAGGPAAGDFNGDGYPDLFLPSPSYTDDALNELRAPASRLYMNDGSIYTMGGERFLDVTDVAGIDVRGAYAASWADVDNDGHLDLFVGGAGLARLYRNTGLGTFTDISASAGLPQDFLVLGGAWGDYDADGLVDLYLVRYTDLAAQPAGPPTDLRAWPGAPDALLHNDGAGVFHDATAAAGLGGVARRSTSAAFVDVDDDGDADLYVTTYGEPAALWRNDGGAFTDVAAAAGLADGAAATCQAWEDFDADGLLDLFAAHEDGVADALWLAAGDGTFTDATVAAGLDATAAGDAWGCLALDHDGDSDMDLFVANGDPLQEQAQSPHVLTNRLRDTGALSFEDVTAEAGDHDSCGYTDLPALTDLTFASGAALLDWDLDAFHGPGDIVVDGPGGDAAHLLKNTNAIGSCSNTWPGGSGDQFRVALQGQASNRAGLGAKVTVSAGALAVTRQLGAAMAWGGQSLTDALFGLQKRVEGGYANDTNPVSVQIRWPSGALDTYTKAFGAPSALKFVQFVEGVGWKNDTAAPRPALTPQSGTTLGLNRWYTSATVRVKLTAGEAKFAGESAFTTVGLLRYSTDGATWTAVPSPSTGTVLTFAGEGTHKLWVEVADTAVIATPGGATIASPNRAVYLYPIRIDSGAPALDDLVPATGGVYAQGRELARVAELPKALVLAPVATDVSALRGDGGALAELVGSDGTQPVQARGADATSGVWRVDYTLQRTSGTVVAQTTARLAPYVWAWPTSQFAAGEYLLTATLSDVAGNAVTTTSRVVLVPTSSDGVVSTVNQGPSFPQL
ncbi:MAG TPA: CRTAC1 family protein [Candidatus Thermoplasmatota archaeon]|jgi:hypothetical protein|nr:CRTAC1 family protein [Candidatus Thermoplasmatota archaeon]